MPLLRLSFIYGNIILNTDINNEAAANNQPSGRSGIMPVLRRIIAIIGFLAVPIISFCLFEYVTGSLSAIAPREMLLNIGWYYFIYLILLGISGTTRFAVPFGSVLLLAVSMAETFVVEFRSRPITPWDITALGTALSVTKNYSFELSRHMVNAIAAVVCLNIVLFFFPLHVRGLKQRIGMLGGCGVLAASYAAFFFGYVMPTYNYELNVWDFTGTYEEYGFALSSAIFEKYIIRKPPAGYSRSRLAAVCSELEDGSYSVDVSSDSVLSADSTDTASLQTTSDADTVQPVNIICIMNESFSDLSVAGDFTTNTDYLPYWNSLDENVIRGSLCVPVFGSMTSNSEFEFLTGDSMSILPFITSAYQFNVQPGAYSLVSTLKSQGYKAIAMHPYPRENWNRNTCYSNFGFDEFYDIEDYEGAEELRNYVSDKADFDKLIEAVENKDDPSDKLFLFNVTMQNHGGYDQAFDNFDQEVWLTGDLEGKYPLADRYLSLIKKSDEAFQYLTDYFSHSDEPTMIVMFGDHQPSVEEEFYDDIAGMPSSDVPAKDTIMWYQTPFMIWTNYDQPYEDVGRLSSCYLSSYMLRAAGLEMTPYNRLALKLSEAVPVIHPNGCYTADGSFYSWNDVNAGYCPDSDQILDYEYFAYNHCLDSRKYTEAFTLKDAG